MPRNREYEQRSSELKREIAQQVKDLLWMGISQARICRDLHLTTSHVSRIFTGHTWPTVPWPDNSYGGMPHYRRNILEKRRYDKMKLERQVHLLSTPEPEELWHYARTTAVERLKEVYRAFNPDPESEGLNHDGIAPELTELQDELDMSRGVPSLNPSAPEPKAPQFTPEELHSLERTVDQELDAALEGDLQSVEPTTEPDEPPDESPPELPEPMPFEHCLLELPRHPLLERAEKEGSKRLQTAIGIVMKETPPTFWRGRNFAKQVVSVLKLIPETQEDGEQTDGRDEND